MNTRDFMRARLSAAGHVTNTQHAQWTISATRVRLLTSDEFIRTAATRVENKKCYNNHGVPTSGGLMSSQLGAEGQFVCSTCFNGTRRGKCLGHNGVIHLPTLLFAPQLFFILPRILSLACHLCGVWSVPPDAVARCDTDNPLERISFFRRFVSTCPSCLAKCVPFKSSDIQIQCGGVPVSPFQVSLLLHACFESHPTMFEDIGFAGGIRPEHFVIHAMGVPAKRVRPAIHINNRNTTDDMTTRFKFAFVAIDNLTKMMNALQPHLTSMRFRDLQNNPFHMAEFVDALQTGTDDEINSALTAATKVNPKVASSAAQFTTKLLFNLSDLQTQVMHLFNSNMKLEKARRQRAGESDKVGGSSTDKLTGKMNLIRRHLCARRLNQTSRGGITAAHHSFGIDQLGVPRSVAMCLSRQEAVTSFNKNKLKQAVLLGAGVDGGANFVEGIDGHQIELNHLDAFGRGELAERIDIGWSVGRVMRDGDVVFFLRPPALHCMNILAFNVYIVDGDVYRFPQSAVAPFNADFDGDAMNLTFPQSPEAEAELRTLMLVREYIINPTTSTPIVTPTLSVHLGVYILSDERTTLSRREMFDLVNAVAMHAPFDRVFARVQWDQPAFPATSGRANDHRWSGLQALSMVIPRDLTVTVGGVRITRGQPVAGRWTKSTIGSGRHSLISVIVQDYGTEEGAAFINGITSLAETFLQAYSISLGVRDLMQNRATFQVMQNLRARFEQAAEQFEQHADRMRITDVDRERGFANHLCQSYTRIVSDVVLSMTPADDMLRSIVDSGAKGSISNITMMRGSVSQQYVANARVFVNPVTCQRDTTYACFGENTHSTEAFGMTFDAYGRTEGHLGMSTVGYLNHAAASLDALSAMATAVPVNGYTERKLSMGCQNITTFTNAMPFGRVMTVTNANILRVQDVPRASFQHVVQLTYGENGMNTQRVQPLPLPPLLEREARAIRSAFDGLGLPDVWCRTLLDARRNMLSVFHCGVRRQLPELWPLSFNGATEVARTLQEEEEDSTIPDENSHPSPDVFADMVFRVLITPMTGKARTADDCPDTSSYVALTSLPHIVACLWWLKDLVAFGGRTILVRRTRMERLLQRISRKFNHAFADNGTAAGLLAACGISAFITQMKLNMFHLAGQMQVDMMKRLDELIRASSSTESAQTHLCLRDGVTLEQIRDATRRIYLWELLTRAPQDVRLLSGVERTHSSYDRWSRANMYEAIPDELIEPIAKLRVLDLIPESDCDMLAVLIVVDRVKCADMREDGVSLESICVAMNCDLKFHNAAIALPFVSESDDTWGVVCVALREVTLKSLLSAVNEVTTSCVVEEGCGLSLGTIYEMRDLNWDASSESFTQQSTRVYVAEGDAWDEFPSLAIGGLIDPYRSFTNNILATQQRLGIVAARELWKQEIMTCCRDNVAPTHMDLIADMATVSGRCRTLILSPKEIPTTEGFWGPAAFSQPTKALSLAALYGTTDHLTGVAYMFGRRPVIGTGALDVISRDDVLWDASVEDVGETVVPFAASSKTHADIDLVQPIVVDEDQRLKSAQMWNIADADFSRWPTQRSSSKVEDVAADEEAATLEHEVISGAAPSIAKAFSDVIAFARANVERKKRARQANNGDSTSAPHSKRRRKAKQQAFPAEDPFADFLTGGESTHIKHVDRKHDTTPQQYAGLHEADLGMRTTRVYTGKQAKRLRRQADNAQHVNIDDLLISSGL